MVQLYELTFVEHKFQSLPYILKWDGMEAGSVTLLINYDKYQTWMVDEFGNKRYLLSESRVITNADYTGFKLLVKFTGQVLGSSFTPDRYTFKYLLEHVTDGGTIIENLYVEAIPAFLP